jgi:equilibrative nucleoside transporter 1/2/3
MKKYHPSRVLTLVYQPFAIGTLIVLAYYESKINTRLRNLAGFTLFFVSTFLVLIVSKSFSNFIIWFAAAIDFIYIWPIFHNLLWQLDLATSGRGGIGPYIGICFLTACFGIADAHIEGGMVGDLYLMCPEFVQVDLPLYLFKILLLIFLFKVLKYILNVYC